MNTPNNDNERVNNDMRSALISTGVGLILLAGFYFTGGRQLLDSARVAEETQQAQQAAEERLRNSEQAVTQMQSEMDAVQGALTRGEIRDADGSLLKDRLSEIERQLQALPALSDDTRAQIDAAASRRARSRAELIAAESLISRCEKSLAELSADLDRWETIYLPVLDDDRGRKIANDMNAVAQLATLFGEQIVTPDDVASWKLELQTIAEPIRSASSSGKDYFVSQEDEEYLEGILTRVQEASKRVQARQLIMDRFLLQSDSLAMAGQSLRDAMTRYEQQAIAELTQAATQRRQAALKASIDEQSAAIQKAEEDRIRAATQVRLAEMEAERAGLIGRRQELDEQVASANAEAARAKLEAEFRRDEAELKSLLHPFLDTNGESQPNYGSPDDPRSWHSAGRGLGPTSFSRLEGSGALEDSQEGRKRLYFLGGDYNNLRRKGGFPNYVATGLNDPNVVRRVSRARELLVKYGPLMVEKGMLQR